MSDRYTDLFNRLADKDERAFVPFVMAADPSLEDSLTVIRKLVAVGADALELGVPFSDPSADGPTIQASHTRALAGGATVERVLDIIRTIRGEYPELPIGMLVYGNVPVTRGLENFYHEFHAAGADSILLPDVPLRESEPFVAAARAEGIDTVFIAPAHAGRETLADVATQATGYVYAISRDGVTGTERAATSDGLGNVIGQLAQLGAPPVLVGFGISTPEHVRQVCAAGAAGAITGSAITDILSRHLVDDAEKPVGEHGIPARKIGDRDALAQRLHNYVKEMKAATSSQ